MLTHLSRAAALGLAVAVLVACNEDGGNAPPPLDQAEYLLGVQVDGRDVLRALHADGSLHPVAADKELVVGSFAASEGCPTFMHGSELTDTFVDSMLYRISAQEGPTPALGDLEVWDPRPGPGCMLTWGEVRRRGVEASWPLMVDRDSRDGLSGRPAFDHDRAGRALGRDHAGGRRLRLEGGAAVAADAYVSVADLSPGRGSVAAKVTRNGKVNWSVRIPKEGNYSVRMAGDYVVVAHRYVLRLSDGKLVHELPRRLLDVRPDGSAALAAELDSLLVLSGAPSFARIRSRIPVGVRFSLAAFADFD